MTSRQNKLEQQVIGLGDPDTRDLQRQLASSQSLADSQAKVIAGLREERDDALTDNAKLRVDLEREADGIGTCEGCGAPLFDGDDYVSDPDGVRGCWHTMTDRPSSRERPCYAYRVGEPSAARAPKPTPEE